MPKAHGDTTTAPSDIPWAAGPPPAPKLCQFRQCPSTGASRASCPCNPLWALETNTSLAPLPASCFSLSNFSSFPLKSS